MDVKNAMADKLLEGVERHEANHEHEQWVLNYTSHVIDVKRRDVNGKEITVRERQDVTVREYVELLRKDEHWGQSDDLHLAARTFNMDFVLIHGDTHNIYPYAEPNMPNRLMVSL